jgi:anti-sigma factor RsiW
MNIINRHNATEPPPSRMPVRRQRHGGRPRPLVCCLIAAVLAAAVVVAGCGATTSSGVGIAHLNASTTAQGSTESTTNSGPLAFAECMRKHGLPDFPDPTSSGQIQLPAGLTTSSPAYENAAKACGSLIGGRTTPKSIDRTPQMRTAALELAHCMRSHGVPNFPDGPITKSSGINQNSPTFQRAFQSCKKYLTGLPGSGQVQLTGGS